MKFLRTLPALLGMLLLVVFPAVPARAVVVNWTGNGTSHSVTDSMNWDGPVTGAGGDDVSFGNTSGYTDPNLPSSPFSLNHIFFAGSSRPIYTFDSSSPSALFLNGNLSATTAGGDVTFTANIGVALSNTTHYVDLVSGSRVAVNGVISNATSDANIYKSGDGTLELNGANTFTGGVQLDGGWLLVGNDAALGMGELTLNGGTLAPINDVVLNNPVTINSGTKLGDCDTTHAITFNGVISGNGAFDTHGYGHITFNGNSSGWSGGIIFYGANEVILGHGNALGTGPVTFDAASETNLFVSTGVAANIGTLSGGGEDSNIELRKFAKLTINQTVAGTYAGSISGYSDGDTDYGLVKNGAGTLTLSGQNSYSGPTIINAGKIVADGSAALYYQLGHGAVTINSGATLDLRSTTLINSSVAVESGAKLTGYGSAIGDGYTGSVTTIKSGGVLSPGTAGVSSIGELAFDHLVLQSGAIYEFNMQFPTSGPGGGWDLASITNYSYTLHIDSTTTSKLTLKVISLDGSGDPGVATGFTNTTYHWMILDGGMSPIMYAVGNGSAFGDATFDPNLFNIDASAFTTNKGGGIFSLSEDTFTHSIWLNFTPVPEPSTYALMALGLAGTGFAAWRKRRRG